MQQASRDSDLFYVAPSEAPPPRRPPPMSVGVLGWLRDNLFSSTTNSILTIIMAIFIVWAIGSFLTWALRDAEWSVITTNLRLMMVGQYDTRQIWRVSLVALVTLFLCGVSVALAVGVSRSVLITLAVVVIAMLIVPVGAAQLPPPPIRYLVTSSLENSPMLFTGNAGQQITITIEPLDDNAAASAEHTGYLENTAGLQNSRNAWNDIRTQVDAGTLGLGIDPRRVAGAVDLHRTHGLEVGLEAGGAGVGQVVRRQGLRVHGLLGGFMRLLEIDPYITRVHRTRRMCAFVRLYFTQQFV